MADVANASSVQLLVAPVVAPGTQPSTGFRTLRPLPSGIQNWQETRETVADNSLSPYMVPEKGAIVRRSVAPTIVHNFNKDWIDTFGAGLLRSVGKVPGTKGVARYYPTAITSTGYTVASLGDLPDGTLVYGRGAKTSGNNGLKKLATATTTSLATSGLTAETISTAGSVCVEPCGFEFTSGDLKMDASGNLTTTTKDCTTLGLVDGQVIFLGGTAAGERLTSVPLGTYAYVNGAVTTNLIPLRGHATVVLDAQPAAFSPGVDAGTGKTVRIFYGVYYRNVPMGHADYLTFPCWCGEKRDLINNVASYDYNNEMGINSISIPLGLGAKVEATLAFIGDPGAIDVPDANRITGPSTAYPTVASDIVVTTCDGILVSRILDASTNAVVVRSMKSCTLTVAHNATPREALGSCGPEAIDFGRIDVSLDSIDTYVFDKTCDKAIKNLTTCRAEVLLRNGQFGCFVDLPALTLGGGAYTYAENQPVTRATSAAAFRDPTTNRAAAFNVFPYLPV